MKIRNIFIWILSSILAIAFLGAGISKLIGVEMQLQNIASWGFPSWTRFPIGIGEVILAIGLLIPAYRKLTIYGIFIWTIVAVITHIQASPPQYEMIGAPIMFSVIAFITLFLIRKNEEVKGKAITV